MTEDEIKQLEEIAKEIATPEMLTEWLRYMQNLSLEAREEQRILIDQAYQEAIDFLKNQEPK